jgi:hypothetical protein
LESLVTISQYVQLLETELHVTLGTRYLSLVVKGDVLPVLAQRALSRYAATVVAFLKTGLDAELPEVFSPDELSHLGFARMATGVWSFPDGDDAGDRILAGLDALDPQRQRAIDQHGRTSRSLPITLTPASAAAGHYSYVLHRGSNYDPLPFDIHQE